MIYFCISYVPAVYNGLGVEEVLDAHIITIDQIKIPSPSYSDWNEVEFQTLWI